MSNVLDGFTRTWRSRFKEPPAMGKTKLTALEVKARATGGHYDDSDREEPF